MQHYLRKNKLSKEKQEGKAIIQVRLPKKLKDRVTEDAKKAKMSVSQYVRVLLTYGL